MRSPPKPFPRQLSETPPPFCNERAIDRLFRAHREHIFRNKSVDSRRVFDFAPSWYRFLILIALPLAAGSSYKSVCALAWNVGAFGI